MIINNQNRVQCKVKYWTNSDFDNGALNCQAVSKMTSSMTSMVNSHLITCIFISVCYLKNALHVAWYLFFLLLADYLAFFKINAALKQRWLSEDGNVSSEFLKQSFKIYRKMSGDKLDTWLKILEAHIKKDQTNYCDLAHLKQQLAARQMYTQTHTATLHVTSGKHHFFFLCLSYG